MARVVLALSVLVALLLLLGVLVSFADSTTPNIGLTKPSHGKANWDSDLNGNFDIVDTKLGPNAIGPTQIDETANYQFQGQLIKSLGGTPLTCGTNTAGKLGVRDASVGGVLEYCGGEGTPALHRAAFGDSNGNALTITGCTDTNGDISCSSFTASDKNATNGANTIQLRENESGSATLTCAAQGTAGFITFFDDLGAGSAELRLCTGTSVGPILPLANDTVVLQTSTDTLTGKTLDVESIGNVITTVEKVWLAGAGCNNATAGTTFDVPTSSGVTASCFGTAPVRFGALDYVDGSTTRAVANWRLPSDWSGAVDVSLLWFANAASSNAVRWQIESACVADSEGLLAPTFNTGQVTTSAYTGTANQRKTTTFTSLSMANCSAGETVFLQVERIGADGADTLTATAELLGAEVTFRRSQ